jgi:hypothetical protein
VLLHVTLATAQVAPGSPARSSQAADVDFASPRAQDVLDEFARERLGAEALAEVGRSFQYGADAAPSSAERVAYFRALFEALVEREPIATTALRRLARFRTSVVRARLTEQGLAESRVASDQEAAATNDGEPVALPLAVGPTTL